MRYIACLFLLLICEPASGRVRTLRTCGRSIEEQWRIIGGKHAEHGSYPWMVSLHQRGLAHVCGATIIHENMILSAAHCFDEPIDPRDYVLYVGLHQLPRTDHWSVQKLKIAKIIVHEKYNGSTYHNDIAIIRPAKPINLWKSRGYVNGICLPKTNDDPEGYAKVIGWGHTVHEGENSDILREVDVPIIPRRKCNEAYDDDPTDDVDDVIDTMICAGMDSKDSCQNDSGGPLFQEDENGIAILIGIVSHGAGCGHADFPGIYTKVASFMDWLEKQDRSEDFPTASVLDYVFFHKFVAVK